MKPFKILSTVLLTQILLLTVSCASATESLLEKEIEAAGKECPIEIADVATITEISYENKVVTYVFNYSSAIAKVLQNTDKNTIKTNLITGLLQSKNSEKIIQAIIDAEASMNFTINDENDNLISRISLTPEELSDLMEKQKSGELQLPSFIEASYATLEATKASLPVQISEGVFMTGCDIEINTIVYTYRIDIDEFLTVSESDIQAEKEEVAAQLSQLYSSRLADIRRENVKFRYVYNNNQGQKLYEYTITADDLSK